MPTYKKISKNIQQLTISNQRDSQSLDWINITNAGKSEIEYLRKKYNFKLAHLSASVAKNNSPRPAISHEADYVFIILHFPVLNSQGKIYSAEIEFFLGHGFLITLPSQPLKRLEQFFNLCKKDGNSFLAYELESSAILLYEIITQLLTQTDAILDSSSLAISQAEQVVLNNDLKKAAAQTSSLRHNLINIRKISQGHKNIFKRLLELKSSIVSHEQMKKYYGILIEHSISIWETLESQKEMVEVLNDSYESMADYRLSNIMKTLTIFYVIFSSLTLIAAIFGMNVSSGMPLVGQDGGFWAILGFMGLVGVAMYMVFKGKKWI